MRPDWDARHTFVVEGFGEFPFDMLRHSQAWPESADDAAHLVRHGRRQVCLVGAQFRHISRERWASFGWPVVAGFDEHGYPADHVVGALRGVG